MIAMPSRHARHGTARGFTLIEVLIAVAIMVALVGSMFAFLNNLLASRQRMMEQAEKHLIASTLIDRIEGDLMTCLVGDSRFGAGVTGSASELTILHRSVAANLAEQGMDSPAVFGDLQRSAYRFEQPTGALEARRESLISARSSAQPPFWPLGNLGKVRFRFNDGDGWVDSYDSLQEGRLPRAVEVAIWFEPWPGEEQEPEPEASDEFTEPERLTFSTEDVFDENAFENSLEFRLMAPPPPDRIRVIAIPDADAESDPGASTDGMSSGTEVAP